MTPTEQDELFEALRSRLEEDYKPSTIKVVRDESPLGIHIQANAPAGELTTVIISPNRSGASYKICGVRSFNPPGEIEICRLEGPDGHVFNAGSFDSAVYSLADAKEDAPDLDRVRGYFTAKWGTITTERPLTVTYAAIGCPAYLPFINWCLFGRYVAEVETEPTIPREDFRKVFDELMAERVAGLAPAQAAPSRDAAPSSTPESSPDHPWGIPRAPLGTIMRRRNRS